ncbi:MAG: lpxB [Micavibrio sp.]|nr:lpxB [Micavibrio sp.]
MKVYLIAGEASGDVLGSLLMKSLRAESPGVIFHGIGGPLMEREGLHSLFQMNELSVMGLAEVLPKLKALLGRIRETIAHIGTIRPDIVITIDAPDFSFRVAKGLREQNSPAPLLIHYVAPTVWAWRPGRAKKVADIYDGILCMFPFEPVYFQKHKLPAAYVGHPVMEQGYVDASGDAIRGELGIGAGETVLGLMFGSRHGEVARNGEMLRAVAGKVQKDYPDIHLLAPTLPHIEKEVRTHLEGLKNVHVICDPDRKPQVFTAMNAAVAISGTVALELAVANVPHVITYRMNQVTWEVIRRVVKVRYAHLANILLNKEVVPEFIQDECTPEKIVPALTPLLKFGNPVEVQCAEFATVRKLLHGKTKDAPSLQAARFVIELFAQKAKGAFKPFAKAQ